MNAIDVLVAEDDDDTRRAVVTAVTSLEYPCRSARDGREALAEQEREAAAIVLTDWRMPYIDGLELCHELKKRPSPPYVILMTTVHPRALLFDAIRGGADEFLRKPFSLDELEVRLLAAARLIGAHRHEANVNPSLWRASEHQSRIAHVIGTSPPHLRARSSARGSPTKTGETRHAGSIAPASSSNRSRFRT